MQIGTNLSQVSDWSTQRPFIDAFKSSRGWMTQDPENFIWNTNENSLLKLDSNKWVTDIPDRNEWPDYTAVGTLMYREMDGQYPGGRYIIFYKGEGTLEYGYDAQKDTNASRPGRDVIDVTPSDSGIWLQIRETDPKGTGNYIRDIRVIPEKYETSNSTFNPDFVEKIQPFTTLRYMDWMKTNNSPQMNWSDRPTPDSASYAEGVPVEVMVELANETDSDPWFTMPHQATDEYVTNFARYVKENLESGRKVYVEYSNEVWNSKFEQSQWVLDRAKAEWGSSKSDTELKLDWYSKRTTEVTSIWDSVFGDDSERVIGVMGGVAANIGASQRAISYQWTDEPKSHSEYGIDALAIAPYFGYHLGEPTNANEVESWTRDSDGGLNRLFEEIKEGDVLSSGPDGGALAQSYRWMEDNISLAKSEGLDAIAYEGGQHLVGNGGVENNDRITELFVKANRDPRMGDIYRDYFHKWNELGGGLFVHYSSIDMPDKWGNWGAIERLDQDNSPKYDAILDAISWS